MVETYLQTDDEFVEYVDSERIQQAVVSTLQAVYGAAAKGERKNVTVSITRSSALRQLNQQYRGIDAPTDVLSFENRPDPNFPAADPAMDDFLGDVVIAYPIAQAQALSSGHAPADELLLLTVHGMLHLLGFDHGTPEEKIRMWSIQRQIMTQLGLAHIQPTEN